MGADEGGLVEGDVVLFADDEEAEHHHVQEVAHVVRVPGQHAQVAHLLHRTRHDLV